MSLASLKTVRELFSIEEEFVQQESKIFLLQLGNSQGKYTEVISRNQEQDACIMAEWSFYLWLNLLGAFTEINMYK